MNDVCRQQREGKASLVTTWTCSLCAVIVLFLAAIAPEVRAQTYPSGPVKIVIPYPAGAGVDLALRLLAPEVSKSLGQPVVVDNRPGAGAIVGMEYVAKAAPDGYTIGIADAGPLAINPATYRKLPYDPVKDFAPVILIATLPTFLAVHPNLGVDSVTAFIALAKQKPGAISYASGGKGTSSHLAMELLKSKAGIDLLHVPYKGTAPALAGVLSGDPSVLFGNMLSTKPYMESGRLRVLAVATSTRSQAAPQIPTVAEAGVPGFEYTNWFGVVAPASTPTAVIERIAQAFRQALDQPEIRRRLLTDGGMEAAGGTPAGFADLVRKEIAMYADLVKQSGIQPE